MADNILILEFNRGREEAFRTIYKRYIDPINAFAARYLPVEDAEDVTADVFIKLFQLEEKNFKGVENIKAWLLHCVRNACINKLRHENTKIVVHARLADRIETESPDWMDDRERLRIQEAYLQLIYNYIDDMPEFKKDVFRLSFIQRLKNREVAQLLDTTEDKVVRTKKLILRSLRHLINDKKIAFILFLLFGTIGE